MTSGTKLRLIWAYWDWLRPCYSTMQNFVCFAKKSVNRKPFLVSSDCALACAVALEANFCRWSTRKSFHRNHLLSTLRALGSVQFFLEHSHEWFLFTYQNVLNCHQTSKMPSRTFWRQPKSLHCFVRQQNPLFLGLLWHAAILHWGRCYFVNMTNYSSFNWHFWLYRKVCLSQMRTRLQK